LPVATYEVDLAAALAVGSRSLLRPQRLFWVFSWVRSLQRQFWVFPQLSGAVGVFGMPRDGEALPKSQARSDSLRSDVRKGLSIVARQPWL